MENQHAHIKGYRDLSAEEIAALNCIKEKAEEVHHTIASLNLLRPDPRWVAIATTHLQQGFMARAGSAVAKPTTF